MSRLAAVALGHGSLFPPADSTGLERPMSGPLSQVAGDQCRALAGRRPRFGRKGRLTERAMATTRQNGPPNRRRDRHRRRHLARRRQDRQLGQADAGESGIRAITRFPTEGLKTRIAGTIDFLRRAALLRRAVGKICRSRRRRSHQPIRHRLEGDFPGPLFLAVPPIEIEWPQRLGPCAPSPAPMTR